MTEASPKQTNNHLANCDPVQEHATQDMEVDHKNSFSNKSPCQTVYGFIIIAWIIAQKKRAFLLTFWNSEFITQMHPVGLKSCAFSIKYRVCP